jgi:hypothetical protein
MPGELSALALDRRAGDPQLPLDLPLDQALSLTLVLNLGTLEEEGLGARG